MYMLVQQLLSPWPDVCAEIMVAFVFCLYFTHILHYGHCLKYDYDSLFPEHANSHCGKHHFIRVKTGGIQAVRTHNIFVNNKVKILYGTPLMIECFGADAARLAILKNGVELQTETWNQFAILWSTRKPDIQNSTYACTDTVTGCEQVAIITVTPALKVVSPDLQHYGSKYDIQYGKSMSVVCSGSYSARLTLTKGGERIPVVNVVDHNTIDWIVNKPDLQISEILCTDVDTSINSSVVIAIQPLLYIQSNALDFSSSSTSMRFWRLKYGDSFEIVCISPQAVKLMNKEDNKELSPQKVNETTVKLLIRNLKIGKSVFECIDSEVTDYKSTIHVVITPRIDVLSPNVKRVDNKYVVKYGDPVEIICSGTRAEQLTVDFLIDEEMYTVNETTVKWIIKKPKLNHVYEYYCSAEYAEVQVVLTYDTLPEAVGFHCVSHSLQYLNCSWKTSSDRINVTLFIENSSHAICTTRSRFCIWYEADDRSYSKDIKLLSFLLQSCNDLGCYNQSFVINHLSIVRLAPPQRIQVISTSYRGVLLTWLMSHIDFGGESFWSDSDFQHKVQYWYSGIQVLEVNSSLVTCYLFEHCKIKLALPCPGLLYKVWVYQKLRSAIGEEFWSEPSTVTFRTDDENNNAKVDTTCDSKPEETAEVAKYFVRKLQHEVRQQMPQIRKEVMSLQEKRAMIHAYLGIDAKRLKKKGTT